MSAYVVNKEHIDAMVAAGLERRYGSTLSWYHDGERHSIDHSNADQVGATLWAENVRSVEYRYSEPGRTYCYGAEAAAELTEDDDGDLPGSYVDVKIADGVEPVRMPEWIAGYRFPPMTRVRPAIEILKAISCLDYQSCEHPEWKDSEAFAFCEALKDASIGRLPGYEEAPWGVR